MHPTRMKIKQWLFTTCVVFYVANHVLLVGATSNTTILESTSLGDAHVGFNSTHNASVTMQNKTVDDSIVLPVDDTLLFIQDNVSVALNDTDNASVLVSDSTLDNTTALTPDSTPIVIQGETSVDLNDADNATNNSHLYNMGLYNTHEIMVLATGSMYLKSSSTEDVNNAVLQWYYYCENYIAEAWKAAGYNQSSLRHAYDWVQIDDSTLDVFFMGTFRKNTGTISVKCLNSVQTLQNKSSVNDACSHLTLGGFGNGLVSGSRTKLDVKTNFPMLIAGEHATRLFIVNSIGIIRMSGKFAANLIQEQNVIMRTQNSRISIFDSLVVEARTVLGSSRNVAHACPTHFYSSTGN